MSKDDKSQVWKRAEVSSPCVQLCTIHPVEQICTGCYRTINEIAQWGMLTEERRRELMDELPTRAGQLKKRRGGRNGRKSRRPQ